MDCVQERSTFALLLAPRQNTRGLGTWSLACSLSDPLGVYGVRVVETGRKRL